MKYLGIGIAAGIALALLYGYSLARRLSPTCPKCGSQKTDTLCFSFHRTLYGCRDCGYEWRMSDSDPD